MRTNIDIDDELLAEARRVAGTATKKETVEYALRALVATRRRVAALEALRGLGWDGDLARSREGRSHGA